MLAAALLPLKRYADFRGRSARTEVVAFWLLLTFANLLALFLFSLAGRGGEVAGMAFMLAIACPSAALFVRRLHDQGRAGWWALAAVPALGLGLWVQLQRLRDPFWLRAEHEPVFAAVIGGASSLALLVLLLLPPQTGPNRYGPDPRDDPDVPY